MGSEEINIVCSADDIALITDTEDDLLRHLYNFYLSFLKFNMKNQFIKRNPWLQAKNLYAANWKLEIDGRW